MTIGIIDILAWAQIKEKAWVKVFRIIPEFRILRLPFQRRFSKESQPQSAEFCR